jgi:hypothetical protein
MATNTVQVINGRFQDNEGNALSGGWLLCTLSHDSTYTAVSPTMQVVSGITTKITLDNNGNVAGTQFLWPTSLLNPTGAYYTVVAYNYRGLRVWQAPQYWTITSPGPIDLGSIISTNP